MEAPPAVRLLTAWDRGLATPAPEDMAATGGRHLGGPPGSCSEGQWGWAILSERPDCEARKLMGTPGTSVVGQEPW